MIVRTQFQIPLPRVWGRVIGRPGGGGGVRILVEQLLLLWLAYADGVQFDRAHR